jgi:hypothetical protein
VPVGGFFCNGEIGPVGGTTFLHGYTSSFGLFRPRKPQIWRSRYFCSILLRKLFHSRSRYVIYGLAEESSGGHGR